MLLMEFVLKHLTLPLALLEAMKIEMKPFLRLHQWKEKTLYLFAKVSK